MAGGLDRVDALQRAFEFVYKSETDGSYCEFGVYQGVSLLRAIRADDKWRKKTGRRHIKGFYGFDSFEGLPELEGQDELKGYEVFQAGQFNNTSANGVWSYLQENGISTKDVELIPGFYSQTLCDSQILEKLEGVKFSVVHIDCDLYSSAASCLQFLNGRLVDGAVLLFDDWFCYRGRPDRGVRKAMTEWHDKYGSVVTDYFEYSWAGKAFIISRED